jgi:MYXO-CTERM domain-containing protein
VKVGTGTSIFGGDKDDDRSSVTGVVALRVGTGGTFELCSGALIAPNVVLTARHCVTKNLTTSVSCDEKGRSANGRHVASNEDPKAIGVYVGAAPSFAQKPHAYAHAIVAPESDYLCDSDIALVVLETNIEGVEPLKVRIDAKVDPGEMIRSVGYGQNDKRSPIGTRFRRENVSVLAMGSAVSPSKTPLGPHEFEVGMSICQGDSGGPAISEETGAVIGVVSRGGDCDEDFGHIYTTTSGFRPLFDRAFAIAGGAPQVDDGSTTTHTNGKSSADGKPTEASSSTSCSATRVGGAGSAAPLGLALAGALVLARRRRR